MPFVCEIYQLYYLYSQLSVDTRHLEEQKKYLHYFSRPAKFFACQKSFYSIPLSHNYKMSASLFLAMALHYHGVS